MTSSRSDEMIDFPVIDAASNESSRTVKLSSLGFGCVVRGDLLTRVVHYQLAKRRLGTASTKRRGEVRGGGHKPYRQKGTGNARQGTIRAPQYRTGGVVFGPHPRDYAVKMTKKERALGLRTALSAKREAGELIVVQDFGLERIKTKAMLEILKRIGADRSSLIVLPGIDANVELSVRNLPGVDVILVEGVNVYDILSHEKLVMTEAALAKLEERLANLPGSKAVGIDASEGDQA
ncbi:50S ribosomal protein L4 [Candidatus Magnetaquicoccaceae bacterium FCR-1]|uniref:Large ribosomal subunit protein uL4 n=2 Tax=Candidatus Magnetaquiglobus chichijimensis TaxID=3141448 RepID=A0ABQ0CAV7_9PROT